MKLKLTYNNIAQMVNYFKSIENAALSFKERRALISINDCLKKEFDFLISEVKKIAEEYCERDENNQIIILSDGSQKIKDENKELVADKLNEIYLTEIEIDIIPVRFPEEYFNNFKCDSSTFNIIVENFIL